jgi:hypothetical protein
MLRRLNRLRRELIKLILGKVCWRLLFLMGRFMKKVRFLLREATIGRIRIIRI